MAVRIRGQIRIRPGREGIVSFRTDVHTVHGICVVMQFSAIVGHADQLPVRIIFVNFGIPAGLLHMQKSVQVAGIVVFVFDDAVIVIQRKSDIIEESVPAGLAGKDAKHVDGFDAPVFFRADRTGDELPVGTVILETECNGFDRVGTVTSVVIRDVDLKGKHAGWMIHLSRAFGKTRQEVGRHRGCDKQFIIIIEYVSGRFIDTLFQISVSGYRSLNLTDIAKRFGSGWLVKSGPGRSGPEVRTIFHVI